MGIVFKVFEVVKMALPFVKGLKEPNVLESYLPSKRLLINLPILFAMTILDPNAHAFLTAILPVAWFVKLTAAANIVTMFWDYWKKASTPTE